MKSNVYQLLNGVIVAVLGQILCAASFAAESKHSDDLLMHRTLLQEHRFDELDRKLQSFNDGYINGEIDLRVYFWSVRTLWRENEIDETWLQLTLKKWVQENPSSAQANIVMGRYYREKAYQARGSKFAHKTSADQLTQMEKYFREAESYLEIGLKRNPNVIDGHISQFSIIKATREQDPLLDLSDKLLKYTDALPNSVKQNEAFWSLLLQSSIPRWGGSYIQMRSIVDNYALKNIPSISQEQILALRDTITYDQMSLALIDKNYKSVLRLGEASMTAMTSFAGVYMAAANAAKQIKDYRQCYEYAFHVSELSPWDSEAWEHLGFCALKLEKWEAAKRAYKHKVYLKGISKYDVYKLGISHMHLYEFDKAYAMFKKALDLDPEYKKYTQRYTDYIEMEKPESMVLEGTNILNMLGPIRYHY